jgi:uncharacterized protein (TIGR00251 family)
MAILYRINNGKLILQIHLQPGARTNEIVGVHDNYLKIKVKAPAIKGKANAALIKFLALKFNVAVNDVVLTAGRQSRYKQVTIFNIDKLPNWLLTIKND